MSAMSFFGIADFFFRGKMNAFVRTCTHCFSESFVGFPFGAFIHVPFSFALRIISAASLCASVSP